ncbi:hypothetical protein NDA17_004390 [Ustilago hordei]|nr:hypothetical protein NDA17_004390 [Ustilago hordei]
MGPLHGATKFAYVLFIHDTYSSMIWARGLTNKSQASQEAAWMAFAAMVMDGAALVASGQQLHSANGILLELLSLNKATSCNDWNKWQQAMIDEMASMNKMDIFELADILLDGKLIGVHWVFKLKLDAQQQAM